jgi:molybdenum cofactor biosynthesis protein MoaC
MRDVSNKIRTLRTARAKGILHAAPETIKLIKEGKVPKGDPLPVAKVAAVQAAKNTSQIIPYCHPLPIDFVGVDFVLGERSIEVAVDVKAIYKTGVEMEALTAASVALLTMYDMLKMLDEEMKIGEVYLAEKRGGKSDFAGADTNGLKAAVIVMSDSISAGKAKDTSGKLIVQTLEDYDIAVEDYIVVPDDQSKIESTLLELTDERNIDLIVTTGGTGAGPRDCTPEVVSKLLDKELEGVSEAMRSYGQERMPKAMLSRSLAGLRKNCLILCLPGSSGGVQDSLSAVLPSLFHVFKMLKGCGHK